MYNLLFFKLPNYLFSILFFGIIIITAGYVKNLSVQNQLLSSIEIISENNIPSIRLHAWRDNNSNFHSGVFKVNDSDVFESSINKEIGDPETWGELYKQVNSFDRNKMKDIYETYRTIYNSKFYTSTQFADIVVTSVQNIPYALTLQDSCVFASFNDDEIQEMINDGIKCIGNIYAGIYTPLEFMKYFEGDCDTRTLFIYTVLKTFGYDVKILNSDYYGHSVIGLNLASNGKYKVYNGKRYYTWEVTSRGWKLGEISPEISDMNYWYVAL